MSENRELTQRPRRRGPMGRGMQPGEKPKDLKKSVKKLMQYIAKYKIGILQRFLLYSMWQVLKYLVKQRQHFRKG